MQYLLTQEEYDALRGNRAEAIKEVLGLLTEEFSKVEFHEDKFGVGGAVVRLPAMKEAIARVKDRFL